MAGLKKTHRQFRAVMREYKARELRRDNQLSQARATVEALWWFIENVGPDDPSRTDIFFELRANVFDALRSH
jgi:hypothetical protein